MADLVPVTLEWRHWKRRPRAVSLRLQAAGTLLDDHFGDASPTPMVHVGNGVWRANLDLPPLLYQYVFQVEEGDETAGLQLEHNPDQPTTVLATGRVVNYVDVHSEEVPDAAIVDEPAALDEKAFEETPLLMTTEDERVPLRRTSAWRRCQVRCKDCCPSCCPGCCSCCPCCVIA